MEFNFRRDQGYVVLAKRGSGKTTLIKYLCRVNKFPFFVIDVIGNLKDLKDLPNCKGYILVNPHDTATIDEFLRKVRAHGNCLVVLDEADRLTYPIGSQTKKNLLSDLVNLWRNLGIGYLVSARRTSNIPKDFLANQNWAFVFRHTYPADLKILSEWFGIDRINFTDLEEHEFIIFHEDKAVCKAKLDLDNE
jgi:hypothetical protein